MYAVPIAFIRQRINRGWEVDECRKGSGCFDPFPNTRYIYDIIIICGYALGNGSMDEISQRSCGWVVV